MRELEKKSERYSVNLHANMLRTVICEDRNKPGDLYEFLGAPEYTRDKYQGNEYAGVVTGLAWTAVGGEILSWKPA